MSASEHLGLSERLVLSVVTEGPTHGFAISALLDAEGPLGQVWQVPRPVVYRALTRLADADLVRVTAVEPGQGPQRHVYVCTPAGARIAADWLRAPVAHVREIRSHLLLKLALLDRRGQDPSPLLDAQRAVLEPIVTALEEQTARAVAAGDFQATVSTWRLVNARAALAFLDAIR